MSMTYNSLLGDLRRYLERGDPADTEVFVQLPSLVELAERDIATKLKILGFVNVVTNVMTPGTSVYAKPNRWRETTSINFGREAPAYNMRTPLFPRSYEYCRDYWPDSSEVGEPQFYADYNYTNWLFSPTPDEPYPFEVLYWQLPALLSVVNQTNWLTDFAPNALLYGALLQATPFLKNDERIPVWQGMYNDQLQALDGQDLQRIIDRSVVRTEN